MMKKLLTIITAFLVIALLSASSFGSAITSNGLGGGTWATGGTWAGGSAPGSGDDAVIANGDVVTLGADASITNCTVNTGGTLDAGTHILTVSATFTLRSNAEFEQAGTVTTVPGGGGTPQAFDPASTYLFYGDQVTLPAGPAYGNLTWSSDYVAIINGNLTVNGDLTLLNCVELRGTNSTAKTHTIGGNLDIDGSSAILEGSVGSGTGDCIWNITKNVTTENSGGLLRGSFGATTSGNTTYNIGGDFLNNGSVNFQGGASSQANTLVFNGSSTQTISGHALTQSDGNQFLENLTINKNTGSVNLSTDLELTSTLALMNGSLNNGAHLTLDANAIINRSGGALGSVPSFPSSMHVTYSGNVTTGPELPTAASNDLGYLTINTSGTVTLNADATVKATLTFTSGYIALGTHNLTIGTSPGTISGASSSQYVVTNSTGYLIQSVPNTSTDITFPVGPSSSAYNPVILNCSSGATLNYSVLVASTTSHVVTPSEVVNDQWTINEATNTAGNTIAMTLQWNHTDDGVSFSHDGNIRIGRYSGSGTSWTILSAPTLLGSGPYTALVTGMTGSGIFQNTVYGIGNPGSALPVELTSFTAAPLNNEIQLAWATATEVNNFGFDVERGTINNWMKIGFVAGHGTTNAPQSYSFVDGSVRVGKYSYRLKQIDHNGNFVYSQPVAVTIAVAAGTVWLDYNYPNPFNPSTKISFVLGTKGRASLKVYNLLGQEVATLADGEFNDDEIQTFTFDASKLSSGIYYYRLNSANGTQIKKMLLLK